MDVFERLGQLGEVERVDQAVLDAALRNLAVAIGEDTRGVSFRVPVARRRSRRITVTAVAAAFAAAAVFAAVAWLGSSFAPPGHPRGRSQGPPAMATVVAAFSATSDEILMVTKFVRGEGTCCTSIMWISQTRSARGTIAVRSRIQTFSTGGSRLSDMAISYAAPATAPATAGGGCDGIFLRPKIALPPAPGIPGTLTEVNYPGHVWVKGKVRVQAATVPGAAPLRACLRSGQWRDAGQRVLAGVKVIEFVRSAGLERLWVSASTYLPVRLMSITPTPFGRTVITFAFAFLRPTVANQAALAPPSIPPGFSRQPR